MSKLYQEKLSNPKWQRKRLEVLQRDNFTCTSCGNTELELHVHHVDYIPGIMAWDYPMDMLKTLCHICHERESDRDKVEKYLYNSLKMKGFMVSDLLYLTCLIDKDTEFTEALLKVLRDA